MTRPQEPPNDEPSEPNAVSFGAEPATAGEATHGLFSARPMLFPNAYTWLLLFSAMDIMLTWVILSHPSGREVNALANMVIQRFGLEGAIVYKFGLVLFFIVLCEFVGRLRLNSGRGLSRVGIAIAAFPVVWSLWLLLNHR